MSLEKIFNDYRDWYRDQYCRDVGIDADDEESDPLRRLEPLTAAQLAELESTFGKVGDGYRALVLEIGVGSLSVASDGEPVDFTILAPDHISDVREGWLSWLVDDTHDVARERQNLETASLVPFLVDPYWDQWALRGNQFDGDDRVFLFSHEQEQRSDVDPFDSFASPEAYFAELFDGARKRHSPWYLWTGHR